MINAVPNSTRRAGRPFGSLSQSTIDRARAQDAMALLESIMNGQDYDHSTRIHAAATILVLHRHQTSN